MKKISIFCLIILVILLSSCAEMSTEEKAWLKTRHRDRSALLPNRMFRLQFYSDLTYDDGEFDMNPPLPGIFSWGFEEATLNLVTLLPSLTFTALSDNLVFDVGFLIPRPGVDVGQAGIAVKYNTNSEK